MEAPFCEKKRPTQKMEFLNLYGLRKRRSGGPFLAAENSTHHRNKQQIEAIRNTTMDIDAAGHQRLRNTLLVLLLLTITLYQNQESVRRSRISRKWGFWLVATTIVLLQVSV
jgi:hypothetical protein